MTADDVAGYEALATVAERALLAASTGDTELLDRLLDDWAAATGALPAEPPILAGHALQRASAAHAQLGVVLRSAREGVGRDLARVATGRRTASGYGAGTLGAAASGLRAEHRA